VIEGYGMRLFAQAFWLPKAGNKPAEYEDAFAPKRLITGELDEYEGESYHCAIADGATETSFAAPWAKLLTRAYAQDRLHPDHRLATELPRLQKCWKRLVSRRPLPWYAEAKANLGAFASLLGLSLSLQDSDAGQIRRFETFAVGDSCIFQVRDDKIRYRSPLLTSDQFTQRPVLFSSLAEKNEMAFKAVCVQAGEWHTHDCFLLMTDALACWFLRAYEQGETPWRMLRDLGTCDGRQSFADWVSELRTNGSLKNDDVTLLRVDLG